MRSITRFTNGAKSLAQLLPGRFNRPWSSLLTFLSRTRFGSRSVPRVLDAIAHESREDFERPCELYSICTPCEETSEARSNFGVLFCCAPSTIDRRAQMHPRLPLATATGLEKEETHRNAARRAVQGEGVWRSRTGMHNINPIQCGMVGAAAAGCETMWWASRPRVSIKT